MIGALPLLLVAGQSLLLNLGQQEYRLLQIRLAKAQTLRVEYTDWDGNRTWEVQICRPNRASLNGPFERFVTDGVRTTNYNRQINRVAKPGDLEKTDLPGFESFTHPDEAIEVVDRFDFHWKDRFHDRKVIGLVLRIQNKERVVFLDPESKIPVGSGTRKSIDTPYRSVLLDLPVKIPSVAAPCAANELVQKLSARFSNKNGRKGTAPAVANLLNEHELNFLKSVPGLQTAMAQGVPSVAPIASVGYFQFEECWRIRLLTDDPESFTDLYFPTEGEKLFPVGYRQYVPGRKVQQQLFKAL